MSEESVKLDSIVLSIIEKFKSRAALGKQKYGTDLDRTDLQTKDWILHAQEELMDGILYLEKLKQTMYPIQEKRTVAEPPRVVDPHWGC